MHLSMLHCLTHVVSVCRTMDCAVSVDGAVPSSRGFDALSASPVVAKECRRMHACLSVSIANATNAWLLHLSPWCIGVPASWLRIWCSRGVLQCTRAPSTHMSCIFTMCNHCHMLCTTLCNLACIVLCTLMCLSGCLVGGDGTPKVCRVGPCNARVARPYRCRAPGHGAGNCLARRVCIIR